MSTRAPLCVLLWASLASAADVQVHSTTLLDAAPELVNPAEQTKTLVPLYEMMGLTARNIQLTGFDDFAVAFDGWASFLATGPTLAGDLNVAYLEGLTFGKHLRLKLGRQMLIGGGTRMLAIDGLSAEVKASYGLGVSAFIGNPVVRRFSNFSRGDFATGGRVFFAPTTDVQAGVSLTHIGEKSTVIRQDLGVDGRWRMFKSVTLDGNFLWSLVEGRMAELDFGPRWQPLKDLEISAGWRRTSPDLFLPRNSIFTVFADTQRDDLGATISYQLTKTISVVGDAKEIWLNNQSGYDMGLMATLRPGRSAGTSLTAQVRKLSIPVNGYTQGRLAGRYTMPVGLSVYADLDYYVLDEAIRNTKSSFSVAAGATYSFNQSWMAGLSLIAGSNPYYESHTEVMAKLTYVFPEARQ